MIKKIIVSLSLLFSVALFAQEATSTPYSYYGIGDIRFKGSVENRSMGGLGVVPDSTNVNLLNPASYSSLKLTSFAVAGTYTNNFYKTYSQNETNHRVGLDYLTVGFPMKKAGIAVGLIPYSAVGYRIRNYNGNDLYRYQGNGGVNSVFFGYAHNITKKISFGLDVHYKFGKITTKNVSLYDGLVYATRETNTSYVNGLNLIAGLTYKSKINDKLFINTAVTYAPEYKLQATNERNIAVVAASASSEVESQVGNAVIVDSNTKIVMPAKISFGAGLGDVKRWFVGTEYTLIDAKNATNRFADINSGYETGSKFTLGGYFVPNYKSFTSYYKRVTYRAGLRYEKTGLLIRGTTINDSAISFGLGLPLPGTFSKMDIGIEYGAKGTIASDLVKQNYFNLSIGLSLNDKWFQKSKYD